MLDKEVEHTYLRQWFRKMLKNLLSHQVAASALCRKMEGGLSDHIYMDEMAFVCKFKIIILILMHLECIFCRSPVVLRRVFQKLYYQFPENDTTD